MQINNFIEERKETAVISNETRVNKSKSNNSYSIEVLTLISYKRLQQEIKFANKQKKKSNNGYSTIVLKMILHKPYPLSVTENKSRTMFATLETVAIKKTQLTCS